MERNYHGVRCELGAYDKALIDEQGRAVIVIASESESHDPAIVAHELMHLWLGTKGWNMSGRFQSPHLAALPEGETQAVDECFNALENYIEHRLFVGILHAAGVLDRPEELSALQKEEEREADATPFPPVLLGAVYLEMRLGDTYVGDLFAEFLRGTGRERALRAATVIDEIIEKETPRTQTETLWTIQHCFDELFVPGSSYLRLTP